MTAPIILPHEHVFSRFRTSDEEIASAFLKKALHDASQVGVTDIVDLTAYTNPLTYLPIVSQTSVRVHACVGYYLDSMVRRDIRAKSAAELARLLLDRYRRYTRQTTVVGIKIAARHAVLTEFEAKAFQAVVQCHHQTGLPVITHSPDGALSHMNHLVTLGVPPDRILLSHPELALKGRAKRSYPEVLDEISAILNAGSSICITDLYAPQSNADTGAIRLVAEVIRRGWASQVLLSGDMSWHVRKKAADFRGSSANQEHGFRVALCAKEKLQRLGVNEEEIDSIYFTNPANFYRIRCEQNRSLASRDIGYAHQR